MSDHTRAAIQVAVAQLVEVAGFDASQNSSLEILNDLLIQFMSQLGSAAHSYAEVAGRTTPNAIDMATSLQELGIPISELQRYVASHEDLPFAQTVTDFPIPKSLPNSAPSFAALNEVPPSYIPSFLPALPDSHTYIETSQYTAAALPSVALPAQQQQGEEALEMLQARLQPQNELLATVLPETAEEQEEQQDKTIDEQTNKRAKRNPFLEQPVWEETPATLPTIVAAASGHPSSLGEEGAASQPATAVERWKATEQTTGPQLPAALVTGDQQFRWAWIAKAAKGANKEDGYDDTEVLGVHDKAARRQKRVNEGTKLRVESILAAHGDMEGGDGVEDEAFIVRETI